MKFKGKDGNVYDNIIQVVWNDFCSVECSKCALSVDNNKDRPAEAARLMGYEVIEDGEDINVPTKTEKEDKPMTRGEILEAARKCVCGERAQDYGQVEDNFQTIANLWMDYLQGKGITPDIEPKDVAVMMALLKIARIATGHDKADNWVDVCGYMACGGEIEGVESV